MTIDYKILDSKKIELIIPLVDKLNEGRVPLADLRQRFAEMVNQNYECAVISDGDKIIGVSGIWYCTRHYVGKTAEVDHVFIEPEYRNKGLGDKFMNWIEDHIKKKGCGTMELNTYVENFPSHKFYYNKGFISRGFHMLKRFKD